VESAKTMVLDMSRERQTPYAFLPASKAHGDLLAIKSQTWIEDHRTETINYERLALTFHMSRRSLERRFKRATGITPLGYLQQLRVESAKRMLEEGVRTFNEITYAVGYEDIAFFRKVFVRLTGLRPKEYQQRFTGYSVNAAKR
jgi:transcriptional regulator GlxA family with amidase domain